jgi:serine/threonine-protein kinase
MKKRGFVHELQRRHVGRVAVAYVIVGWILLQLASILFPTFDAPAWVLKVVIVILALGFPVTLVLAWAFEMTPDGVRLTEPAYAEGAQSPEHSHRIGKRINAVIIGVLVLAVAVLGWQQFRGRNGSGKTLASPTPSVADVAVAAVRKSIAVLPLINESGDASNEYFSDGLSEELIAALMHINHLKVISRGSSFQFRDSKDDSKTIGEKLGVTTLLEGSVRRQGDRVRIVAELVNAADGSGLWSHTYDRELKDIFAVQSEIAQSVAAALQVQLLGAQVKPQAEPSNENLDAYRALLQGNFYAGAQGMNDYRKAIDFYNEAIRLDDHYALAHSQLAAAWLALAEGTLSGQDVIAAYAKARAAAKTALALDPNLAGAHVALGEVLMGDERNLAQAEAEFRRAIELAPSDADPKVALAALLASEGKLEAAVGLLREALAINPLLGNWQLHLANYLIPLGKFDEAKQAILNALATNPPPALSYERLTIVEIKRGDPLAAQQAAQRESDPFWRAYALALAQQAGGDHAAADAALQTLIGKYTTEGSFQIATVYAMRGQPDKVFEWLDRAEAVHDPGISGLLFDPFLLAYKNDPRFAAFCRKVGLPAP